jgi:hypothetical protein
MIDSRTADERLSALLAHAADPEPDPAFAERVVALASYDVKLRRARRRTLVQVGKEALALGTILAAFAFLSEMGPAAGFGESVPAGSPAMAGLVMLILWAIVAFPISSGRRGSLIAP